MKNLIKTIQNTIFQQELFRRGAKIVVGVSGGADSVCLLDALVKIASKADLELIIAHVNYGLRGKDSDKDEKFVRKLAEKYGVKIEIFHSHQSLTPSPSPKGRGGISFPSENVLRETRYNFFEKVRKENNFDLIAVAHNADDQAETFLLRIIRGAGLQGLSAMKYKNGKIIRPLLNISRQEILNYLKKNKLKFRTDKTNAQDLFLRNKVRNKLIPYLEKNFNPNIRQTILRATENIAEDYDFIAQVSQDVIPDLSRNLDSRWSLCSRSGCGNDRVDLSIKKLLELHPALQKRIILQRIAEIKSDLKDIEAAHVAEILKIAKSTKGKNQVVVFKGLKITRKGDRLIISK